MKKLLLFLLLILPTLPPAQSRSQLQSRPLVFTHVTIIDATGAAAKPEMTVVLTGDRITELGPAGKVRIPKDAQVIDAMGKFLIPGLWDMHVHALWNWRTDTFLPLFIANGVTGVRDMYGDLEILQRVRRQIADGARIGPRIVTAGPIVDGPKPVWGGSIAVATEAEGRQAVDDVKKRGADFVKVYSLLPRAAYFAIADEAKKQGIPFAGHVPSAVSAAEASDAGQKSIEHLGGISMSCATNEAELRKELAEAALKPDATVFTFIQIEARARDFYSPEKAANLFARFVRNDTWQCPTLTVIRAPAFRDESSFTNDPRLKYILPNEKQRWTSPRPQSSAQPAGNSGQKQRFATALDLVKAMRQAGVGLLAGTDTPNPYCFPGFSLHDELALLVKAGLTPMEALQAATRNPAKYLGQLDSLGTVERGKIADLVLLEANPLADISNTQKINAVVVGGKLIPKSEIEGMLAKVEAAANRQ